MVTTTDLISYYSFDSNGNDDHGSQDLSVSGATNTACLINNGYSFDGINDYLYRASFTGTLKTISFWVKPDTTIEHDTIAKFIRIPTGGAEVSTGAFGDALMYVQDDSAQGEGWIWPEASCSFSQITNSAFHHICLVWDSTNEYYNFWFDGVKQDAPTDAGTPLTTPITMSAENLYIARRDAQYFGGDIDELGFWSRSITDEEVAELYNSGAGLAYPFAVGNKLQINIGDSWKEVDAIKINIGDSWKEVNKVFINIGDTWKVVY